jgi:hypothetical protein
MNMQAKSQKYGHLIAAGGMVVALIGFFLIPFVTMSYMNTQSQTQISSYTYSAIQAAGIQGFIWLDALLASGILLVALLLALSRNPFGMSRVPLDKQVRLGAYALIGAIAASMLLQYIVMTTIPGSLIGMFSSLFSTAGSTFSVLQSLLNGFSMSYATGSWFYFVGMLIAIGGEIYALYAARPAAVVPAQVSSPYMPPVQSESASWQQPSSPYQQGWPQPNQPPSQPVQEQYPPQQYPPPQPNQPPSQPVQEQYPPQQYPPPQPNQPPSQPVQEQYPPQQYPPPQPNQPPSQPPTEYQ